MGFKERMDSLESKMPAAESMSANRIRERLITAQSVCESVFGKDVPDTIIVAVMSEISTDARWQFDRDERLFGDFDPE